MQRAVVVGTGMMGSGIAAVLATQATKTILLSRSRENAVRGVDKARAALQFLFQNEMLSADGLSAAQESLVGSASMDEAVADAKLVVEATPENMEMKKVLLNQLDKLIPSDAILATTTSALSITELVSACVHAPERILTAHFWNPAHLVPLVELVPSPRTSATVISSLFSFLECCGKVPILVRKDRPGQLGNRIHQAMIREAVNVVAEGIASAEDVDKAVRNSFGMRLPVYGIFEHQDIVGLDLAAAVVEYVSADLYNEPHAPAIYGEMLRAGRSGAECGHGFYDWSQKNASAVVARRDLFLAMLLRLGVTKEDLGGTTNLAATAREGP